MDQIIQYRQMMAEQKFSELQRLVEVQLSVDSDNRFDYLMIYVEALRAQQKQVPSLIILELAEKLSETGKHGEALALITGQPKIFAQKFYQRLAHIKVRACLESGQMSELHKLVSDFLIHQFETQNPVIPVWIREISQKYFANDFSLLLKELSLSLLTSDITHSEELTKSLILSCIEKASPKGISEKINIIAEVLRSGHHKAQLEIYQNLCLLMTKEELEKTDYKRLVEMVIYFEDFKFQVLLLSLLHDRNLPQEASQYAEVVKANKDYSYVYFDKYYSELKSYFFKFSRPEEKKQDKVPAIDLKLSAVPKVELVSPAYDISEDDEEESQFFNLLKHQTFTADQLCDLAVSFLQAEMPKVALKASCLVLKQAASDKEFLKGSYLKLTSELLLKDYRAALDTSLNALTKATTRDDILSFLYGQAEIHIRLNQKSQAKKILTKIVSIDVDYRSAKERLDKLNEI